ASIFLYLDSPKETMASVSTGFILLRAFMISLLAVLMIVLMQKITPSCFYEVKKKVLSSLGMLLLGGILFLIIRGGVSESTSNVGQVYFSSNQFLNHSAVNPLFSMFSSLEDSKDYSDEFNFFDEKQRAQYVEGLYPTTDGDHLVEVLNTKRPNILLILMEGFGSVFVEPLGGLSGVSPNLNRLSKEGVFFTQCYANSFRTDRGTVSVLSGYLGLPTVSVMKLPVKSRTLPAISEELLKVGYQTDFVYGGDINFTNMKSYLLSKGYQQLTADSDFSVAEQSSNVWGVNDDITSKRLLEQLKQRKDGPWFTTYLTLSSHEPFEVPYSRLEEKIPNAFAYTDECLGKLIDELKESPLWENLLIVCIPDHGYCYPQGTVDRGGEFSHIPMLWLGGAVKEPMQVNKIMNQTDLAATLLGQLGLDHSMFSFSRNVLGSDYTYPFAFYSSGGVFSFRDSTGVSAYDTKADRISFESPSPSEERLNRGKAILQTAYDDLGNR
ncbi:MAG: LTA synthase family protein, partial [Parabacteroides sp.]|nr:LTA synthase family protein [Parabacteroides sp.]